MTTAVAVFTRDLRVHDNPVLAAAAAHEHVVPLFVLDERIVRAGFRVPNRERFLAESLADLDERLRELGGRLVVRQGEVVAEIAAVAEEVDAAEVHLAADASAYAQHRQRRLADELRRTRRELQLHDDVHTVLPPGRVTPQGKDHFAVFTPYHRRWADTPRRALCPVPDRIRLPKIDPGRLPDPTSPPGGPFPGGEREARQRADRWLTKDIEDYADEHDTLAADRTSRLSPYLHFGCMSARELVERAGDSEGGAAFVRQLAWRDFHHQVLGARPDASHRDYRDRGDRWRHDPEALQAWQDGRTGVPIVDAGMRQLRGEGWMHNRARLITGSFLTKSLYLDWRAGAAHFAALLLDGDIANNCLNWQWVAGTGTDSRPNRVLNPIRQAERYDPDGDYVRRWVPELADVPGAAVHQPWRLPGPDRRRLDYPDPIVDHEESRRAFLAARGVE